MEISKLTKAGGIIGSVCIIISIIQYCLVEDFSHLIFGVGLGLIILGFSYIYSWMRKADSELKEQEEANGKRYDVLWKEIEELKETLKKKNKNE